jgi:hypothetical protein
MLRRSRLRDCLPRLLDSRSLPRRSEEMLRRPAPSLPGDRLASDLRWAVLSRGCSVRPELSQKYASHESASAGLWATMAAHQCTMNCELQSATICCCDKLCCCCAAIHSCCCAAVHS